MSMITEYVRLRPHELTRLRSLLVEDPDEACEYAGDLRLGDEDEEKSSRGMDTDRAWSCLRHLLAKVGAPIDVRYARVRISTPAIFSGLGARLGRRVPRFSAPEDSSAVAMPKKEVRTTMNFMVSLSLR